MKKRLSIAASLSDSESFDDKSSFTPPLMQSSNSLERSVTPDERVVIFRKVVPTRTANLDRTNDRVYESTTTVVKAIMALSQGVQQNLTEHFLDLVTRVGLDLRMLLTSVDNLVLLFPPSAHKEIEMAHKVLSKDMSELVNCMKHAQNHSHTSLDANYRKQMLSAAHVLAMDAKNLLDVVDTVRMRHPEVEILIKGRQRNDQEEDPPPPAPETSSDKMSNLPDLGLINSSCV